MKRVILVSIVVLAGLVFADRWAQARQEMQVPPRLDLVKIDITKTRDLHELDRLGVIINQVNDDYCIAEASPQVLSQIAHLGFKYQLVQENISNVYYENFFTESDRGRYLSYTEYVDTMHVMAINNLHICRLETLGYSHSNRLILALKISDSVNLDENEPAVYFDGAIHGDEKIAWAVCFEFIKYILNNYSFNPVIAELVNNREIWMVPMINPDGYVSSIRYNSRSVDLNRNFGWMWQNASGYGTDLFSENEATAFYNLFWRQPFVIYTTYHAGTRCISNPWSYTTYDSIPEKFLTWHLAQGYAQRGNNYPYGQGSLIMYTINGSSKDFAYGMQGDVSWSIELHNLKTPPAAAIDSVFNLYNRDAMLYLVHKAGQGISGLVTDSVTEQPLHAQVWFMPRNWLTYTSQTNGDFHKFYLPGTYTVITRCPGYKDDTSLVVVPNTGDSSVFVNIKMVPDSNAVSNYGMRLVGSRYVTTSTNRTYPIRSLGAHDSVAYQLDNTKWIIIQMAKPIVNDSGFDFTVFRSQGTGSASVKISNNWKGPWTTIGTANAARTHFDLSSVSFDSCHYVRLEATSTFYLDAVESYTPTVAINENYLSRGIEDFSLRLGSNVVSSRLQLNYPILRDRELVLSVYDINGRNVRKLVLPKTSNSYVYDLKNNQGNLLKSGVYFIKPAGVNSLPIRFTVTR